MAIFDSRGGDFVLKHSGHTEANVKISKNPKEDRGEFEKKTGSGNISYHLENIYSEVLKCRHHLLLSYLVQH